MAASTRPSVLADARAIAAADPAGQGTAVVALAITVICARRLPWRNY
ncbi:UNVERIFIED_CONTAM: hypothetical protein RF653_08865 [Kocuria sp. CPCC 205316]